MSSSGDRCSARLPYENGRLEPSGRVIPLSVGAV